MRANARGSGIAPRKHTLTACSQEIVLEHLEHRLELFSIGVSGTAAADWRAVLPVLSGRRVTLRQLDVSDAPLLLQMLATPEVTRFLATPPATVQRFERFIAWTHRQRAAGRVLCFGVVPLGHHSAIGVMQIWPRTRNFDVAEVGFVLGSPFWGTGVFVDGAHLFLEFAFETLGVRRVEGRAATLNGRGNGALRKLGAVPECGLRKNFMYGGIYHDHILWSILREDWQGATDFSEITRH